MCRTSAPSYCKDFLHGLLTNILASKANLKWIEIVFNASEDSFWRQLMHTFQADNFRSISSEKQLFYKQDFFSSLWRQTRMCVKRMQNQTSRCCLMRILWMWLRQDQLISCDNKQRKKGMFTIVRFRNWLVSLMERSKP